MARVNPDNDSLSLTPLEQRVSDSLASRLRATGISEVVIAEMAKNFEATRTPSAEALLEALKSPPIVEGAAD